MTLKQRLEARMTELDIVAKRSLGQNFLVSDQVVDRIIKAADPARFNHVWEIGPGLGALTDELRTLAGNFQVVEMDRVFSQYWSEQGIQVNQGDALHFPWADVLKAEAVVESGRKSHLLVSNLPYQISARLLVELSVLPVSFDRMVLMFQKEVAQRIIAPKGSEAYGLLSVIAQNFWDCRTLLEAGTRDFHPSPRVASRVVVFDRKPVESWQELAGEDYLSFVKNCFAQKRKKLAPRLLKSGDREVAEEILKSCQLRADVRPQQISARQFIDLYRATKNR